MTENSVAPTADASNIEARLRHALTSKAGAEPVNPADWSAFAARLALVTRRRQRVLVAAAALALVVGTAGGYFGEVAASPGQTAGRATGGRATANGSPASGRARSLAPTASGPAALCPYTSGGAPDTAPGTSSDVTGSGDIGTSARLFIRTTVDGVTIRVYQDARTALRCLEAPAPGAGSSTGATSLPGSSGSTSSPSTTAPPTAYIPLTPIGTAVSVELSDGDAVGQGAISSMQCVSSGVGATAGGSGTGAAAGGQPGSSPASPPPSTNATVVTPATAAPPVTTPPVTTPPVTTPTTIAPSQPEGLVTGTFGVAEGDPVWWVAVEVGADVTSVQMAFPDGSTDQMALVGGVAVLAHRVAPAVASVDTGPYVVRGTLQLLGIGGGVVGTVTLPEQSKPIPTPVPSPVPAPVPLNQGTQSAAPGVIVECPPVATPTPQAGSSSTTEKR